MTRLYEHPALHEPPTTLKAALVSALNDSAIGVELVLDEDTAGQIVEQVLGRFHALTESPTTCAEIACVLAGRR